MRVLHVYKTFLPESRGGIEETIHHLAVAGRRHGIETEIFTLSDTPHAIEPEGSDYRVHRVRRDLKLASTDFSIPAFAEFARVARRADVVNYHFPWPFMDLLHFHARHGRPSVITYHSDIVRQKRLARLYRPLMQRFLSAVDAIVATSPNYLETSNILHPRRDRVRVIPIGIEDHALPAISTEWPWRALVPGGYFLFVGTFRYYKGLHILLEAIQRAPFSVAIAGAGPIEPELRRQAAALGLTNVHFLGQVSDAEKSLLFDHCRGVVFPSHLRSEAFGIALAEGARHGRPLISSEIGTGTSFVNIGGETGLVVPPNDPQRLREAMTELWNNPAAAERLGSRARSRYEQLFTADRMAARYAELYRELFSAAGGLASGSI